MSVQAMTWAMEQQLVMDPHACSVLTALANHADRDGTGAFPSVGTLQRYTKLSERTIRAKLAALESAGMIRRGNQAIAAAHIARADQRPVVWDLAMERGVHTSHPVAVNGVQDPHPEESTGCSSRPNGMQLTSERGARAAPEPSLNQKQTDISTARALENLNEPFGDPEQLPGTADQVGQFEGHGQTAPPPPTPTEAGAIAAALRRAGFRITSHSPDLLAAVAEGVTRAQVAELAEVFPADHAKCRGSPGYLIATARRQLADATTTHVPRGTHATDRDRPRGSAAERVAERIREAEQRDAAAAAAPYAVVADG